MTIDIHATVLHKLYGKGEVVKITENNIYVLFGEKQRIFPHPDAFEKGYLLLSSGTKSNELIPSGDSLELTQEDIKHHIMVIKVNQRYEENMDQDALYSVVRGIWKASKERAQKVEYAFGVYKSKIVAVYKPTTWYICKEAKDNLPRKDIVLTPKNENRIFFVDESYEKGLPPDKNQEFYRGKSIANFSAIKNAQNPISYLEPTEQSTSVVGADSSREIILDAADNICYMKIYEAINATVGTNYTGWMKAGWPRGREHPFWIWFPKLAESKDGELVSASFDCLNTISDDWNEVVFEDLKDTPPEKDGDWNTSPVLIFAKEPKGGPYIFRGVYLHDAQKSRYKHHVVTRIGTRVKLIGQPANQIVILDDFRKR